MKTIVLYHGQIYVVKEFRPDHLVIWDVFGNIRMVHLSEVKFYSEGNKETQMNSAYLGDTVTYKNNVYTLDAINLTHVVIKSDYESLKVQAKDLEFKCNCFNYLTKTVSEIKRGDIVYVGDRKGEVVDIAYGINPFKVKFANDYSWVQGDEISKYVSIKVGDLVNWQGSNHFVDCISENYLVLDKMGSKFHAKFEDVIFLSRTVTYNSKTSTVMVGDHYTIDELEVEIVAIRYSDRPFRLRFLDKSEAWYDGSRFKVIEIADNRLKDLMTKIQEVNATLIEMFKEDIINMVCEDTHKFAYEILEEKPYADKKLAKAVSLSADLLAVIDSLT